MVSLGFHVLWLSSVRRRGKHDAGMCESASAKGFERSGGNHREKGTLDVGEPYELPFARL
jgi:hypothetical protein